MSSATQLSVLRRNFLSRAHEDILALRARLDDADDTATSHELLNEIASLSLVILAKLILNNEREFAEKLKIDPKIISTVFLHSFQPTADLA